MDFGWILVHLGGFGGFGGLLDGCWMDCWMDY